ncbi:amidohydrolase family protein [Rhizobium sp. S152]|uniref:amidohydrolase family protein n=1 Tax=Rhizobium sp. S152 TaxID=3055038 RepID=UPI0025A9C2B9|nr:amidohydrolase family protein [Rhizobium sp. S152]MDM9627526.1 amidohydrolase family protein [Rhizobium sp. S152]
MIIDAHNHVIPQAIIDRLNEDRETFGVRVDHTVSGIKVSHKEGFAYPLFDEFLTPAQKLAAMDEWRIDTAVISPSPTLFFYRADSDANARFVRALNISIAEFVDSCPSRLIGMGTLPMQSPEASVAELEFLVYTLGIRAVMIGTHIDGVQLADPRFRPLLKRAAELEVFILTHPYYFGSKQGLEPFYLTNLIGNPLDTTVMAAHLIFGGVMEEIPNLKICLSHAGGFAPYQIGRLVHGNLVRPEAQTTRLPVKDLFKKFYFDTITHDPQALRYLVSVVGADHVLLGTDIPYDMADIDPMRTLKDSGLSEADMSKISSLNALSLIGTPRGVTADV